MQTQSSLVLTVLCVAAVALAGAPAEAAGSAFNYQGQLKLGGAPYDGSARFEFSLWDAERDAREVAPPVNLELDVIDGLFSAPLDFGTKVFTEGDQLWIQISVNAGDGPVVLSPRQEVTPTPYAFTALNTVGVDGHSLDGADDGPIDAVYVDASGNVGVGTNRPSAELDVNGRTRMLSLQLGTSATSGHVLTADASGVGTWRAPPAGGDSLWVQDGRDIFYTDGGVGIGTTTPSAPLDVAGGIAVDGFQMGKRPTAGHVLTTDASGVGTWQAPPAGGDSLWLSYRDDIYYSTGNVGIGTSTPVAPLDVVGGIAVDGFQMGERVPSGHVLTADANGVGTWQEPPSSSDPVWNTSGSSVYYSSGNVGIGTSSPTKPLDVAGDARVFNGNLHLGAEGFDPYIELMSNENSDATEMRIKSLDGVGFAVTNISDEPLFVVEQSGDVGIGTTTPMNPLHVISTANSAILGENPSEMTAGELGSEWSGVWGSGTGVGGKGVYGEATAEGGMGVSGVAWATTGTNYGVHGEAAGPTGRGVYGKAVGTYGRGVLGEATTGFGVYGQTTTGTGVYGETTSDAAGVKGVEGYTESDTGYAVYGFNGAGTGDAIGVYGESGSSTGHGVHGHASNSGATTNFGVYGRADGTWGRGVYGEGTGSSGYGGYFEGRGYFSGNVGIGTTPSDAALEVAGDVHADSFTYRAPKERHLSLPSYAFRPTYSDGIEGGSGQDWTFYIIPDSGFLAVMGDPADVVEFAAPVHLPDGAIVTEMTAYFGDNESDVDLYFGLYRMEFINLDVEDMSLMNSTGASDGQRTITTDAVVSWPIENATGAYFVKISITPGQVWKTSFAPRAVVLTYTVDEAG